MKKKERFANTNSNAKNSFKDISPQELKKMLDNREDFILIDVRIQKQKHIQGTDELTPFNAIKENEDKLPRKDKKIVLYCLTGRASIQAAKELVRMGYTNLYNLDGGIVGWKKAGFDVENTE